MHGIMYIQGKGTASKKATEKNFKKVKKMLDNQNRTCYNIIKEKEIHSILKKERN